MEALIIVIIFSLTMGAGAAFAERTKIGGAIIDRFNRFMVKMIEYIAYAMFK